MVTDLDKGLLVRFPGGVSVVGTPRAPWWAGPVCPPVPPDGAVGVLKADPAATPFPPSAPRPLPAARMTATWR